MFESCADLDSLAPNKPSTSVSALRRGGRAAVKLALLAGVIAAGSLGAAPAAHADGMTGVAMDRTQLQSSPTLNSTLIDWIPIRTTVALTCKTSGQAVNGWAGKGDSWWYGTSYNGHTGYIADVDVRTQYDAPQMPLPTCGATTPTAAVDTNAWYTITIKNSGKVVDVRGGGTGNGAALQQYISNGTKSQHFRFVATSSGYYQILSQLSSTQVWDAAGAGAGNGTKVQTWIWSNGNNQQWKATTVSGGYVTFTPRHATTKCLDVPGASTATSVQLQLYTCNGTGAQAYKLTKVGTVAPVPTKYDKAVSWANGQIGSMAYDGLCERFVENAYGTSGRYASAIANYRAQQAAGRVHTSTTGIPKGALVYSSHPAYDLGYGHVEIARGDGTYISGGASTRYGNHSTVQVYTALPVGYLGWAYPPDNWPSR